MVEEYRKLFEQIAMISLDSDLDMGVGDVESTPSHLPSIQNNYYTRSYYRKWSAAL